MVEQVLAWSAINSGSRHRAGLEAMAGVLGDAFAPLGGEVERIELAPMTEIDDRGEPVSTPLGPALRFRKHPQAPLRVFLGGHMDTVFGPEHPFQRPRRVDAGRAVGPGVADLKGGLAVMLAALQALERSPWAGGIGWEVLLNPDEELGSPGSAPLLAEAAGRNHLGLVFEPALPDGNLAGARKGSGNYTALFRGRAAHAGRAPEAGRNAVVALAELARAVSRLGGERAGVIANPALVAGGEALNIVPDFALLRFNLRVSTDHDQAWVQGRLEEIRERVAREHDLDVTLHGGFGRPPKPLDDPWLFELVARCGRELGLELRWRSTGGCCDGNNLAAAGLPNADTLGVRGGEIHSAGEFVLLDSLVERARLAARLLLGLASGELEVPGRGGGR